MKTSYRYNDNNICAAPPCRLVNFSGVTASHKLYAKIFLQTPHITTPSYKQDKISSKIFKLAIYITQCVLYNKVKK